jgi:soluble lytic murein transglycosylase-like protein
LKERLQGGAPPPSSNFGIDDLKRGNQSSLPDEYQSPLEKLRMMVASADPRQSFRDASANIGQLRPQSEQDRIPTTVGNTTTVQKGVQADANSPRGPTVPDIAAPVTRGTPEPVKSTLPQTDQGPLSYEPKTTDAEGKPREISPDRMGTWRITAAEAPPNLREVFDSVGKKHNMNPDILAALTHHESISWKPSVIEGRQKSRTGAIGIAQFMPGTARDEKVNPYDIESSVDGAARYLKKNMSKFDGNLGLGLAAYNQGPGSPGSRRGVFSWIDSGNAARAPRETQNYVADITGRPLQWWVDRYKQGTTQSASMTQRNVPLPPARPDNITTVAKGEQQPADEEAAVQEVPTTSIPATIA